MANLAEQLIQALTQSGAPKVCITTGGSSAYGNFQQPMQLTLELLNRDGTQYNLGAASQESAGRTESGSAKRPSDAPAADEPSGKKRRVTRVPRSKNKVLDFAATLENYAARLRALEPEEFKEFDGAIVTDYKLHNCSRDDPVPATHVFLLIDIATEKGSKPLGYVSSNRKDGKYVEALPEGLLRKDEGGTVELVYVGDKNQFTNQAASKWSVMKSEKVFVPNNAGAAAAATSTTASE